MAGSQKWTRRFETMGLMGPIDVALFWMSPLGIA